MNRRIIGEFFFMRTHSRNLIGEFINNSLNTNITEGANLIQLLGSDLIEGNYQSSWYDPNDGNGGKVHTAILEIRKKESESNTYSLTWIENSIRTFEGKGTFENNQLVGTYTSID